MTEGLPLALGEAGLSGQPIVCTEAGGSREVIMAEMGHVFGRTVNPGSPYELALGQITVLGLFDGLEDVAENRDPSPNAPRLLDYLAEERYEDIYQRIMDMREKRRKLGLRLRELVLKKFSGDRYLREHEQMLWLGKLGTRRHVIPSGSESILINFNDHLQ
jgi:glycosyltransferase involved in cell wall biosynthesis